MLHLLQHKKLHVRHKWCGNPHLPPHAWGKGKEGGKNCCRGGKEPTVTKQKDYLRALEQACYAQAAAVVGESAGEMEPGGGGKGGRVTGSVGARSVGRKEWKGGKKGAESLMRLGGGWLLVDMPSRDQGNV